MKENINIKKRRIIFSIVRAFIFISLSVGFACQVMDQMAKFWAKKTTISQRFVIFIKFKWRFKLIYFNSLFKYM